MKALFLRSVTLVSILFLTIIAFSPGAMAQGSITPYSNQYESYSQMWNTSNVYFNTVTDANLGAQKDTIIAATTYLYTASWGSGTSNADTFRLSKVGGYGPISFTASLLKGTTTTTTNATVVVTPERSYDGFVWSPVPGTTASTNSVTSATVPVINTWDVTWKGGNYFRFKITASVDTAVAQGWYFFQKPYQFSKNQ
jgi:hypothetical protein